MIDLRDLNDEQREAVTHGAGPLLVISAAGSGKTRTLVYRAAHLIEQGADPSSILLCTFTKKSAKEMAERVNGLAGSAGYGLRVGTMHSQFLRVLRAEGHPWPEFDILDEYAQKRLLKELLGKDGDIAQVISWISLAKNEMLTPDDIGDLGNEDWAFAQTWKRYEAEKRERHAVDFDDMLVETVGLFEKDPAVLERHRPEWLLVDEAQDTSTAQWRALELLAGEGRTTAGGDRAAVRAAAVTGDDPSDSRERTEPVGGPPRNITCVADWRQAIYSWRGARPEAILDFEDRFPGARIIGLPRNYRSTPEIVDAANSLIRHAGRELEDMVPVRSTGAKVTLAHAEDSDLEAAWVAETIKAATGTSLWRDHAVLYRTNAYSRAFEEALAIREVPYTVVGSQGFFGRKEVTDIVAYLTLVHDPNDEDALRRIVNRPTRYLGRAFCDAVVAQAPDHGTLVYTLGVVQGLNYRQESAANAFKADLQNMGEIVGHPIGGISNAIRYIRATYNPWLLREEGSGGADESRMETLDELERVAGRFSDLSDFLGYVRQQKSRSKSDEAGDRVQLMTIHRAKGLEWPTVFAVGWSEELLPHRRCMEGAQLEEERRLAYVAATRARDVLYVSTVGEHMGHELAPSRFVAEAALMAKEAVA